MLSEIQQRNYDYFTSHLSEYLENRLLRNKFGVFFDEELQAVYDSFEAAFSEACAHYPMGEFIIQQLIDPSEIIGFLRSAVV